MEKQVTINEEQKLFVIPEGDGYTSFGFDNARDYTIHYAKILGRVLPEPMPYGTLAAYELHQQIEREYMNSPASNATSFHPHTDQAVQRILEDARQSRKRLRLFYGDTETGRDWNEENDVVGRVGRSTGRIKILLLIAKESDMGGGSILTQCIVRILDARTLRELYRHPKYHSSTFEIKEASGDYPFVALADGKERARFKTRKQADRYVDRMTGKAA